MLQSQIHTPEYFHCIDEKEFRERVYEPEADSFLLLDALDLEADKLRLLQPRRCVEIGCGSGIAITHLYTLLQNLSHAESTTIQKRANEECKSSNTSKTVTGCNKHESNLVIEDGIISERESNDLVNKDSCEAKTKPARNIEFYAVDINEKALEATSLTWERTLRKYMSAELEEARMNANVEDYSLTNINEIKCHQNLSLRISTKENEGNDASTILKNFQLHLVLGDLFNPFNMLKQVKESQNHHANDRALSQPVHSPSHECIVAKEMDTIITVYTNNERDRADHAIEFDVILFNPPYVPTSMEELEQAVNATCASYRLLTHTSESNIHSGNNQNNRTVHEESNNAIAAAWCGGPRGRVVIDRFIAMLPTYMSRRGVCYLVLIKENEVDDVVTLIHEIFAEHDAHHFREFTKKKQQNEELMNAQSINNNTHSRNTNNVVNVDLVASRYTGEHLSVYRIAYADNSVFMNK